MKKLINTKRYLPEDIKNSFGVLEDNFCKFNHTEELDKLRLLERELDIDTYFN